MKNILKQNLQTIILLAIIASAPYCRGLSAGFVFDDPVAISNNPLVQSDKSIIELFTRDMWGNTNTNSHGSYRPLVVASFMIDNALGGGEPFAFHLSNIVLHTLVTVLLFIVFLVELGKNRKKIATIAGALFAVHAIHSENVLSIVARADLMSMAFGLGSWLLWRSNRISTNIAGSILFLCALLSKEVGIVFLAVPIYRIIVNRKNSPFLHITRVISSLLAVLTYLSLRLYVFGLFVAPVPFRSNPLVESSWWEQLLTAASLLTRTIGLLIAPTILSADYSYAEIEPIDTLLRPDVILGLTLLILFPVATISLHRRRPVIAAGLAFFLVAYLPISNLFLLIPTIYAERLLYISSAGFCLALAIPLAGLFNRRRHIGAFVLSFVLLMHCLRITIRVEDWQNQQTLFAETVRSSPRSARGWYNLSYINIRARRYEQAIPQLQKAVDLAPNWPQPRTNLGVAHIMVNSPPEVSLGHLRRAFDMDESCVLCAKNLITFYVQHGSIDLAHETVERFRLAGGDLGTLAEVDGVTDNHTRLKKSSPSQ